MQTVEVIQAGLFGDETVLKQPAKKNLKVEKTSNARLSPQDQFLCGVEKVLGFRRIEDERGKVVMDSRGVPLLRVDHRVSRFRGVYKANELGSFVREALIVSCISRAISRIAPLFEEHENERLFREGITLLNQRLRAMRGEDCPKLITECFVEYYSQQDLTMNERTGETLRNNYRQVRAEERRRAAGITPRNFRKDRTVTGRHAETPSLHIDEGRDPELKHLALSVERLIGVRAATEEACASDDSVQWKNLSDESLVLDED